jgi:hypothetical protein
MIPRGATVALAHDADEAGDRGAEAAAHVIGGRTLRLRPPIEGGDWCDWPGTRAELVDLVRAAAGDEGPPAEFATLREFLKRDYPAAESLVGHTRKGTNLLPRYGWVMPWGSYGSSKTSLTIDLVMHAASGREWIGYPVARPLRFVGIVNEGVPGALQDKLREKLECWDDESVQDRIAVYASPWGEFSFSSERMRRHLQDYARDFGADYVVGDPLHTLGTTGTGTPEETEAFKHLLRNFGVWGWIGLITPHHTNKGGVLSGDWGRHPDTVFRVEKDGKEPRTKLTLEKARPADPAELGAPTILEWETETLGYRRVELARPTSEARRKYERECTHGSRPTPARTRRATSGRACRARTHSSTPPCASCSRAAMWGLRSPVAR